MKTLAIVSAPFMPTASDEIWKTLNLSNTIQDWDEAAKPIKAGHKIAKPKPLFKKIEGDEEELQRRLDKVRMHMPKKF